MYPFLLALGAATTSLAAAGIWLLPKHRLLKARGPSSQQPPGGSDVLSGLPGGGGQAEEAPLQQQAAAMAAAGRHEGGRGPLACLVGRRSMRMAGGGDDLELPAAGRGTGAGAGAGTGASPTSSASSDTSDPDWGIDWGGTVCSLPRAGMPAPPRPEEWPSLEPHGLQEQHTEAAGPPLPLPTAGSIGGEDSMWPGVAGTPPWPSSMPSDSDPGMVPTPLAGLGSPFAALAEALPIPGAPLSMGATPAPAVRREEPAGAMMAGPLASVAATLQLTATAGPLAGRVFRWEPSKIGSKGGGMRVLVGRHPGNTMVLADDEVSAAKAAPIHPCLVRG